MSREKHLIGILAAGYDKSLPEATAMEWELREATTADAETVARLIRAAFAEYQSRLDPPSGAYGESAESVREALFSGGAILAFVEAKPIGCVLYEVRPDHFYFGRL